MRGIRVSHTKVISDGLYWCANYKRAASASHQRHTRQRVHRCRSDHPVPCVLAGVLRCDFLHDLQRHRHSETKAQALTYRSPDCFQPGHAKR